MNPRKQDLNLARKWRPQNFDQIVGQDVAIRMIKNSLYLKKLFPVYLFAGQRGCGKTTTARVFAAAINCKALSKFQENPTEQPIPCLTCDSCTAMINAQHPDFIEVDAASHTGVDNVRQIIDSSSYMPLAGQKKVYLIDEVHMLSKAAFNAFLKILEEPPASVLFILATTEIPKIPPTILSRCFQVIFNPIEHQSLKDHLRSICNQENVVIDDAALDLLLEETEGSARDAINLLERVRFSGDHITEQTVLQVLGKLSNKELLELFDILLDQNGPKLLAYLQTMSFEIIAPQMVWDMTINLCRALLWVKYGVESIPGSFNKDLSELKRLAGKCSLNRLNAIFQLLWSQEELFLRTSKKHLFLEMVLLQICEQVNLHDLEDLMKMCQTGTYIERAPSFTQSTHSYQQQAPQPLQRASQVAESTAPQPVHKPAEKVIINDDWSRFIAQLPSLNDRFLASILEQAQFIEIDAVKKLIKIQIANIGPFIRDKIDDTRTLWLPLLNQAFPEFKGFELLQGPVTATPRPAQTIELETPITIERPQQSQAAQPFVKKNTYYNNNKSFQSQSKAPVGEFVNVHDSQKWPVANLIISHFPGKIRKSIDNPE